jgi:hypothetical protein
MSLARELPKGLGTCAYACIICSEVAWKRSSRPDVPAASRLITALTLYKGQVKQLGQKKTDTQRTWKRQDVALRINETRLEDFLPRD